MQKGKNPTRDQKKILASKKLNAKEWLYVKQHDDKLLFRHKTENRTVLLDRN